MAGLNRTSGFLLKTLGVLGVLILTFVLQTLINPATSLNTILFNTTTNSTTPPTDTMAAKLSADSLIALIKNRRSYYPLTKDLGAVTPARIQEIVKETTLHTPSSFNSQSNRLLVLFGAEHDKLWDLTTETLKPIVPEDAWKATNDKMAMFKGAAGTILFFDDNDVVSGMQAKFAPYADKFPAWATQSLGMQQFLVWTALEAEGLGANLQHYNPLIDQKVAEIWKVPAAWKLNAQLVFGGKTGDAFPKEFQPVEDRVKVFGA
ncbi:Fc.00g005710.m01.CDS01 [Cosmosporella sp. VM-42]